MSFTIDASKNIVEVMYFDKVDDELILEVQEELFQTENFDNRDLLVDYTAVTDYQVTMPGMRRLTTMLNTYFESRPPSTERRFAYVVPQDVEYGMGRVFLAYVKSENNSRLFRSRAEALAWLGISDTDSLPSVC